MSQLNQVYKGNTSEGDGAYIGDSNSSRNNSNDQNTHPIKLASLWLARSLAFAALGKSHFNLFTSKSINH
jgi:hypothetical protein